MDWRRWLMMALAVLISGLTTGGLRAYWNRQPSQPDSVCYDTLVKEGACPHAEQRMSQTTVVIGGMSGTIWGVCLCPHLEKK